MNNVPRQTLRRIFAKYGNDLCSNARRCEGLLKDLCGEYRREINVLTNAIDERIPLDLLAARNSMPRELLLTRLAKRLKDNFIFFLLVATGTVLFFGVPYAINVMRETQQSEPPRFPPQ